MQNLRYALRRLIAEPGFTLVIVLAIGLGIGMNTTVFTLFNAVLLRGLPYENSHELLFVTSWDTAENDDRSTSWPDFEDWRKDARSFRGLAAMSGRSFNLSGEPGAAERISGMLVTPNTFGLLGQRMFLGRDFVDADGKKGAPPVAILGYEVWERRFAGDPNAVGRIVRINEVPTEIIGVMEQDVKFPQNADAWIPLAPPDEYNRGSRSLRIFGRLKAGVSQTEAQAEMSGLAARLAQAYPESNKNLAVQVQTINEAQNGGPIRIVFMMLLAAVSMLLLIACANVANLLIARAVARTREVGVRMALGAARRTIIAQLLTESVVLSCLGGVLGLVFAYVGVTLFDRATVDVGKPYWIVFSFDWIVFGWLALICVATGIIFGLAPALQLARTDTNEVLKDASRSSTGGRGRWLTSALVVVEIAFTLALLAGAGMMIRRFVTLYNTDIGVRTDNVLTAQLTLSQTKYPDGPAQLRFAEQLGERLRALPGVEQATLGRAFPGDGLGSLTLEIEGEPRATRESPRTVSVATVGTGFFEIFGVAPSAGRLFDARDGSPGAEAVIVNQRFVERYFGRSNAVGRRIMVRPEDRDDVWATIVGVVPQIRHNDISEPELVVYRPLRQSPGNFFAIALSSRLPVENLSASLRTTVQGLDQDLPVFQIRTMEDNLARQRWPLRVFGSLFALFAVFGLVLSTIGMYAVTAYSVGQRRSEIGLRMALGAQQSHVAWLVVRRALVQLAIGVPLGLALAYYATVGMAQLNLGMEAGDPITMISIFLIIAVVTLTACLVPASRAARMNPTAALRN